jgi:FkbM family methyltransferase
LAYRLLVRAAGYRRSAVVSHLWDRSWPRATARMAGSTTVSMHGVDAQVNAGYAYPAFYRRWTTYNDPLVQLVVSTGRRRGRPVSVVDVGAAVGDTVLLLLDRAPGVVSHFACVEPDDEFYGYLERNLGDREDVSLFRTMLSDSPSEQASLIRTHSGTASAQGQDRSPTSTLDIVVGDLPVDVLKIDTDGFDGTVLRGASTVLGRHRPTVIFEWHPILVEATGQDWSTAFDTLVEHDYRWFVWFTKEGEFSHFDLAPRREVLAMMAEQARRDLGPRPDWHYDVVALTEADAPLLLELASLRDATASRSNRGTAQTP